MTNNEMERLGIHASEYRFEDSRDMRVQWRGTGLWAVTDGVLCLNRDGQWEYEPQPSSRTQEFFDRCRFTLDEALRRAAEQVHGVDEQIAEKT